MSDGAAGPDRDRLEEIARPDRTAVLISECQEGVLGGDATFPDLVREAVAKGLVENIARLAGAARAAGVPVVHCTVDKREDGAGSNLNARLFRIAARARSRLVAGTSQAELVGPLRGFPEDLRVGRVHGLSAMTGTELDPVLRNLGARTVVVTGVSLNIAVTNLVFEAVNRGYEVVVPRDGVAGVPPEYAESVLRHSVSLVATLTSVDDLVSCWAAA